MANSIGIVSFSHHRSGLILRQSPMATALFGCAKAIAPGQVFPTLSNEKPVGTVAATNNPGSQIRLSRICRPTMVHHAIDYWLFAVAPSRGANSVSSFS
jgi:hypothetical protein